MVAVVGVVSIIKDVGCVVGDTLSLLSGIPNPVGISLGESD